jgi:phosphohistidine phosphatase
MKLYLVRHGEAEKVGGRISRDADRRLTATGEETSLWVGRALGRIDPAIGTILTSPLVRAVQTGTLIKRELGDKPAQRDSEMLTPGFRPKDLLKELFALPSVESIVAVGHEPDISRCLGYLIADGSHVSVTMGTGAVAGVELRGAISEYEAALLWFLTPPVVRALFS